MQVSRDLITSLKYNYIALYTTILQFKICISYSHFILPNSEGFGVLVSLLGGSIHQCEAILGRFQRIHRIVMIVKTLFPPPTHTS
jgi:hypothetical protein